MAKDELNQYSKTASSNTDVGGVGLGEGSMVVSDINNAMREIMSHLAAFADGTDGIDVLNLQDDDGSASIKLQAPSTVTADVTLTLPDGDGSADQVLSTDGSGALSWSDITVTASELDVSGNGTSGQVLASDGDGSFSWTTSVSYPQVITILTSGSSYTIPSDAQAVLIRASGAGGGGAVRDDGNASSNGGTGGATTMTNSSLSINISASGGLGGQQSEGHSNNYNQMATSPTGTTLKAKGAQGSRAHGDEPDRSPYEGLNGHLVQQYVTGSSVAGKVLAYSLGSGGTGGSAAGETAQNGQSGTIELWIW